MRTLRSLLMFGFAITLLAAAANEAPAAESYDSCVGDINTVPTVITTGGTWCLRHNVLTNATNTRAVDIRTNNVTIDCNGFRLADAQAHGQRALFEHRRAKLHDHRFQLWDLYCE